MIFVEMGNRKVPALGFGTWQLSGDTCVHMVRAALEIGYRHIDTAQVYKNEAEVGRAIAESGVARDEIFVTTKISTNELAAGQVVRSAEESLRKLGLDHVDLLLIHWPSKTVPLAETLGAMARLIEAGRTRSIGVSNFPVALMREAIEGHQAPIVCNQVEYHVFMSQRAVIDYARAHGVAVTAYCPLALGKALGHPVLSRIGEKYGKSALQVALRWLVEQDGIAAIPRTSRVENARSNFDIFDFALDADDKSAIAPLGAQPRLVDPPWAPEWDPA